MEEIRTLSPRDPNFHAYLLGTFSKTHRALPVKSLNLIDGDEHVTFQIAPVSELRRPSPLKIGMQLVRVPSLMTSLFPLLISWVFLEQRSIEVHKNLALMALVGVGFLHIAVHLLNDFRDHMKGYDGLSPYRGSRVIQEGWMTAQRVRIIGWSFFSLALLVGLYAIWSKPTLVVILFGIGSLGGVASYSASSFGLKYWGLAEPALFLLLGPALTIGFSSVVADAWDLSLFLIGCGLGALVSLNHYLKNLIDMMGQWKQGFRSLPILLGFDRAKRAPLLFLAVMILSFALAAISTEFSETLSSAVLISLIFAISILKRVFRARSCFSSLLPQTQRAGLLFYLSISFTLLVGFLIQGTQSGG